MRSALVALVVSVLVGVLAPPASASHGDGRGHWAVAPVVQADCAVVLAGRSLCAYTAAAEHRWVDAGFSHGFVTGQGAPSIANTYVEGGIKVHVVKKRYLDSSVCSGPCSGSGRAVSRNGHMYGGKVFICSDCGLRADRLRTLVTHEYGHVLGLNHQEARDSVMRTGRLGSDERPNAHDLSVMREKSTHRH